MEFACKFIYVPPSTNQKKGQQPSSNVIKRSALMPPLNKIRPRSPPPAPPRASDGHQIPQSPSPALDKRNEDVRRAPSPSPMYENAAFHLKAGTAQPPRSPGPRGEALLPPTMRPSQVNTQSQPSNTEPITTHHFSYPGNGRTNHLPGDDLWNPESTYHVEEEPRPPTTPGGVSSPPALPPRPWFMNSVPDYMAVLPSRSLSSSSFSTSSSSTSSNSPMAPQQDIAPTHTADRGPLPGNPNVVLVSLGKLLAEDNAIIIMGEPTSCSQCGSVLDSCYDNVVDICYFCQSWEPVTSHSPSPSPSQSPSPSPSLPPSPQPSCLQNGCPDSLYLLIPDFKSLPPDDALLLFCIDISGSMTTTCQVFEGQRVIHKTRLQCVKAAVLQCVQKLSRTRPHTRVGLITFNNKVTLHGHDKLSSRILSGAELVDSEFLKEAAFSLPSPPPLSETLGSLQTEVLGLVECGATALGPAAVLAIAMASRHPGSKVVICTDGKANTDLGNLEVEDNDARTLLSSTIFYQDLGEYAACQGVTVSVLSIERTDCRLDELGRLADRTGGDVVIASPHELHTQFEDIIENRTIATHCSVALLLPKALRVRGERQAGHRGTREVGNVTSNAEITLQFGPNEQESEGLAPGTRVSIQLQVSYRKMDGHSMLRILTVDREVTDDSLAVLSSLSSDIIQLNSSQASAALAVRGRFLEAGKEGEVQMRLIERALEYNRDAENNQVYQEWVKTMDPIYNRMHDYTRKTSCLSDYQSLTDTGAAMLYNMKNINKKSMLLAGKLET